MTLIYVMCHTDPRFHFLDNWFRQEAEKLKLQNITYKYVDLMKKKDVESYQQQRTHDIEADIFKGNQDNYPLADIVYVPDCGGDWYFNQTPPFRAGKMIDLIDKLFEWVKEGGYLYVSKLLDDNIKTFFTDVLKFEPVINTMGKYQFDFYRKKKITILKTKVVPEKLLYTYSEKVYLKQQLGPKRLQQGFLNSIKAYYDNQNKNVKCMNNDNEVYIYLSAMFHNTEVKGSNISVLTKDTDLGEDMEYGNPTKLFEALFSNRAFLRWKKNSFDLSIDQNMMPIMDNRFLQLQNDTETVIRLIKRTDTETIMTSKGTAFSLNLKLNDILYNNGIVEVKGDNDNEKGDKEITISGANKYFFVTTTQNKRLKPLEIIIKNTSYYLASAVVATHIDLNEKAGGHYIALWLHKSLQKALRLDSISQTTEIKDRTNIQMNLQRAVILVYAQAEYIDYKLYDKQFKVLKQTKNFCFINSGLNALRYIVAFHENLQETSETEFNDFDQREEKRILEFSKGTYVQLYNNVNEYIEGIKQKVSQDKLESVVDILKPDITESVSQNKIISHFTLDNSGLTFTDLFNHLLGNVYLKQTIIEHYINVIKYARLSFNPIDKNIIIFELLFVQDIDDEKVLAINHYNILKHYSHLIKIKTSSTFNDVINIPLEDAFSHGVYSSSYMLENVEKNVRRSRQLKFFYDSIEFDLDKLKSILIPVCDSSSKNHFWLYHIFFIKKKKLGYIHCYNKNYGGRKKFQDDHNRYLKVIKEWLQQKLPLVTEWREKQLLDLQINNVACGVYVCQFIREIVKNDLELDEIGEKLNSNHIEKCRKLMFIELLENRILDY